MDDIREVPLSAAATALLARGQREFPLTPAPYAALAVELGMDEDELLTLLRDLLDAGVIVRIGAVVAPHRTGWSTLAAMRVPAFALARVAAFVAEYDEVNHCYEREHEINLWFVATGPSERRVRSILHDIQYRTQLAVIALPLVEAFKLDLGFAA